MKTQGPPIFVRWSGILRMLSVFLVLSSGSLHSQAIQNIMVDQADDTVKIHYDFVEGKRISFYNVMLSLSADSGRTFNIIPRSAKGDIRYGIIGGYGKLISWQPSHDSLELVGNSFVFRLNGGVISYSIDTEFVRIRGGQFDMGDTFAEGTIDELPVHTVVVSDFELGRFPVTNLSYSHFLASYGTDCVRDGEFLGEPMIEERAGGLKRAQTGLWIPDSGYEYHPVIGVTWYGANEFCRARGLRLPTEAELEYAARECGRSVRYGNGRDEADPTEINFNGDEKLKTPFSVAGANRGRTTRITTFPANRLGLYDMSGNVWQWCQDWYAADYYRKLRHDNPAGPWLGKYKVVRGGSWYNDARGVRATDRSYLLPYQPKSDVGFRVLRPVLPDSSQGTP